MNKDTELFLENIDLRMEVEKLKQEIEKLNNQQKWDEALGDLKIPEETL